ncbi:MAG: DUF1189 family protein [Candidatus Woesearchaeota archaeon]|jgi:hypothetical protein
MVDKEKLTPEIYEEAKKKYTEEMHHEYTSIIGFFGVLIRTINPMSYKKLCNASTINGFKFYIHLLLFSFILFMLVTIPYLFSFYDEIRAETNNLNTFTLAPQLDINQSINFEDFGIVVANQKSYDNELLLITQQSIYLKNNICLFSDIACIWFNNPKQFDFSNAQLLVEDRDKFTYIIFTFILLLLPGIFIMLFLFLFVKFLLMIGLFFLIGFIYTTAIRYEIHLSQLFLVALYSLTVTVIVETVFGIYFETYYIPYIASFILFVVSTYLVAEKPFHHFKHGH